MKIALILVLFSSSVIGVFADTDKVESVSVSVMEGDSVTLHTGVTKIQGSDEIEWRFNGIRMAIIDSDSPSTEGPFRDTMQLNNTTGDLKITDVTTTDSGLYKLQITSGSGSPEIIFSVTVISGVNSVSVMEGDSVTLNSGLTKIQRDDEILWSFKNNNIADQRFSTDDDVLDERFRGRLKLDHQTGSLTIMNTRNTDSGEYEVEISTKRFTINKRISVTVNDELKSVSVMKGDPVTLISGLTEIQRDDVIRWSFGKTIIAEIIKADQRFSTHDVPDERFRDRLKLDHQTGSLTITNTTNTHSGQYKVEISSIRFTINKRISVTIDERKSVSVTEGDSVTLISGLTEIQRDDEIRWSFKKTTIITTTDDDDLDERFRDRLKLDNRTGSLTITNTRTTDSGEYQVEIISSRFTVHKRISVTVNEAVTSVLVMKGDSVTLHTGASIPRDDVVLWFGDKGVRITPSPGSVDARWKNTVQNGQTGDLTIRNIRRDQSGDYKVVFVNINGVSKHKKFHIYITGVFSDETDGVKTVSVIKGDSVFLDTSVTEIQNGDLIEWLFQSYFIIAKTDGNSNIIYNENDVRFKNRLNLDIRTGDLTIENCNSEHSGRYQLKIINNNTYTIQKSFSVTVNSGLSPASPDSGLSPGAVAGIVIAVLAAVPAAVGGVFYYRHKSSKPERSREENGQNHTSNKDEETELNKPVET